MANDMAGLESVFDIAPARLVYVDDAMPGWHRVKRGAGVSYRDEKGRAIKDADQVRRIRSLAIPPAYTDVWICPLPDGHLQATGRDARGRKQYRYHPDWQASRGATKFERLREFGFALPRIRRRIKHDLALRGLPRDKVLATIVRLLDTTYLRVGNDEYARTNGSYGLTTLRNRHAAIRGSRLKLSFRGKSGIHQDVELDDPQIARICAKLQELPGQDLFQFVDDDGQPHSVGSADVNDYLRQLSGGDFTAKDFRTWHASALALERLHPCEAGSASESKRRINEVITEVAARLGHTRTVCRKSYVHPGVLDHFMGGRLAAVCEGAASLSAGKVRGLKDSEKQLLSLLGEAMKSTPAKAKVVRLSADRPARSAGRPPVRKDRQPTGPARSPRQPTTA